MSVILESCPGDTVVCIQAFNASPKGQPFSWETSRLFRVGEKALYRGAEENPNFRNRPNGWMVVFEAADGREYQASHLYLTTEEAWQKIVEAVDAMRQSETVVRN
ncbi:MAG: hypothetical protein U0793_13100 [Gemmataceae bacterium]